MDIAWLFGSFLVLAFLGVPIAISLGLASLTTFVLFEPIPFRLLGQQMYSNLDSFPLMAVPFFFLAAALMQTGGVTRRLVDFANSLVGHYYGGLGLTAMLATMLFATISGSGPATVAAVGAIMIPALIKSGYSKEFAVGTISTAGGVGILLPPSIPLIIFGLVTGTSVPKLFLGGVIPGLIFGGLMMLMAYLVSRRNGYRGERRATWSERGRAFVAALPALSIPAAIIIGIYGLPAFQLGGWTHRGGAFFTPTEAAIVASFLALIVGAFIHREFDLRSLTTTMLNVMPRIGMVIWIITNAFIFGFLLTNLGVPQAVAQWVSSANLPVWAFLLMVNVVIVLAGQMMQGIPIILIFVPLLFPAAMALGIDPIHFGVMIIVNIELGLTTPPVGLNLFVASMISDMPIEKVLVATLPWMLIDLFVLILVTSIPALATWLPNLLM
jgi:C4-dicarboxylate transporter, DctM subunit